MFARKIDINAYALFHNDGAAVISLSDDWPIVWPLGSDVSAYYDHPTGIVLPDHEFVKISPRVPVE